MSQKQSGRGRGLCEPPSRLRVERCVLGWIQDAVSCFVEVVGLSGYILGVVFSPPKTGERRRWEVTPRTSATFGVCRLIWGSVLSSVTDS